MELILDPKPYLLHETVAMVYSYVNDISILSARDRMNRSDKISHEDVWYKRLTRLQEILEVCCDGLERENETVQHFFRHMETGRTCTYAFLAGALTDAFMQFKVSDFDGEIQALKDNWKQLQADGFRLSESGGRSGLSVSPLLPGESFLPLQEQIYSLEYPAELRLELLTALLSYEKELDRLADFLRPYAQRLQAHLEAEPWLMDTTVAYWREQFTQITPEEFFQKRANIQEKILIMAHRRVCFSLMDCDNVAVVLHGEEEGTGYGLFILGCAALCGFWIMDGSENLERILSKIRSISDRNKFEILRRLSRQESYCQKLADELACNTGNISRNLTTLWKDGFLIRKEGENRVYYETDAKQLAAFFKKVYVILADRNLE